MYRVHLEIIDDENGYKHNILTVYCMNGPNILYLKRYDYLLRLLLV